ncbi:hypothetical protein Hypma_001363 [Hypsizygus marmoreus]|uniref:Uncharacterized protein n=1 Tax=Hypsizygus marmoreus TaxID=39966 RepID=A0A369K288_HYPMA|nr:hypothetical protein Hypma_001363 [Hypsizygus marmoreus]
MSVVKGPSRFLPCPQPSFIVRFLNAHLRTYYKGYPHSSVYCHRFPREWDTTFEHLFLDRLNCMDIVLFYLF